VIETVPTLPAAVLVIVIVSVFVGPSFEVRRVLVAVTVLMDVVMWAGRNVVLTLVTVIVLGRGVLV